MEKEIWKDIPGYEGLYQISNFGRVKRLIYINRMTNKEKERILTPISTKDYYHINLYKNGKQHQKLLHRIVAKVFIPNPLNKPQVNHKNGIKTDNRVENLEWVTRSENQIHAYKMGLQKSLRGSKSKLKIPINQYDLNGNFIRRWESIVDALNFYGKYLKIGDVCKHKKWCKTDGGYKWEYAKNEK